MYTVFFSPTSWFFLCLGKVLISGADGPPLIVTGTLIENICQSPIHSFDEEAYGLSLEIAQNLGAIGSMTFLFKLHKESHSRETIA